MKKLIARYKYWPIFLAISIFAIAGISIGRITVHKHPSIVNATLGITVLYLLHQSFLSPTNNKKIEQPPDPDMHLKFPDDLKLLAHTFALALIMYWAGTQILDLIRDLLR